MLFATNVSAGTAVGDERDQQVSFSILACQMVAGVLPPYVSGLQSCSVDQHTCDLTCVALDGSSQRPGYFRNLTVSVAPATAGGGMVGLVSFASDMTSWVVAPELAITVQLADDGPGEYPDRNLSDPVVLNLSLQARNHEPYFVPYYNTTRPIVVCCRASSLSASINHIKIFPVSSCCVLV